MMIQSVWKNLTAESQILIPAELFSCDFKSRPSAKNSSNVVDRTQVHFIDGILNAQRYRDEILRPIVVPFIHDHHLMLQHDNARPHVARICTQFLESENIPVLA